MIKFNKRDTRKIVRAFTKDLRSTTDIGKEHGVSCNTIIDLLRAEGVEVNLSKIRTKQFSAKARKSIVKRYGSGRGESPQKICVDYDCSYATIRRVLKEENAYCPTVIHNKVEFSTKEGVKILKQYEAGASANGLSKEFGCSDSVMLAFLRKNDIDTRDYGRGKRTQVENAEQKHKACRLLTRRIYRRHKQTINPTGKTLSATGYNLDHAVSLIRGFEHGLTIFELSHPCNLQILTATANQQKGNDYGPSKRELLVAIKEWNKKHGDPYAKMKLKLEYTFKRSRYRYVGEGV